MAEPQTISTSCASESFEDFEQSLWEWIEKRCTKALVPVELGNHVQIGFLWAPKFRRYNLKYPEAYPDALDRTKKYLENNLCEAKTATERGPFWGSSPGEIQARLLKSIKMKCRGALKEENRKYQKLIQKSHEILPYKPLPSGAVDEYLQYLKQDPSGEMSADSTVVKGVKVTVQQCLIIMAESESETNLREIQESLGLPPKTLENRTLFRKRIGFWKREAARIILEKYASQVSL